MKNKIVHRVQRRPLIVDPAINNVASVLFNNYNDVVSISLRRLLVGPHRTLEAFTFGFVFSVEDGFLEDGHSTFHCLGNKRVQEPEGNLF